MLAETAEYIPNLGPVVGLAGHVITVIALIVVLSILKGFIVQGVSIAVVEWLLKMSDTDSQYRALRWFADGKQMMKALEEIKEKVGIQKEDG